MFNFTYFGILFLSFSSISNFFCRYSVILSKSNTDGERAVIILGDKVGRGIFLNTEVDSIHLEDKQSQQVRQKNRVPSSFSRLWWLELFCMLSEAAQVLYRAQRENLYLLSQCDDCYSLPRAKLAVIKTSRLEHSNVICATACLSCLCVVSTLSK